MFVYVSVGRRETGCMGVCIYILNAVRRSLLWMCLCVNVCEFCYICLSSIAITETQLSDFGLPISLFHSFSLSLVSVLTTKCRGF